MNLTAIHYTPVRRWALIFLLGRLLCLDSLSAEQERAVEVSKPNILFMLADDQRPDTISELGNGRIHTPNLDRLVRRGTTFSRASCSYPICVVSRAEILTGRHGWENGIDGYSSSTLQPDQVYWAEALQQAGYQTWYVGKWHTRGRPFQRGYPQTAALFSGGGGKWWKEGGVDWKGSPITGYRGWVFQSNDGREKYPEHGVGLTPTIDARFAEAAINVIESQRNESAPWFLHVNFTAPHDPLLLAPGYENRYQAESMEVPPNYLPQHPFDHGNFDGRDENLLPFPRSEASVRDLLRVYYGVIEHLDTQVGRILDALAATDQLENTVIVYASDHGMAVGSHGLRGKQNMYEHTINTPLIISGPGIPAGVRTAAQVYLRELYPTTCELVGAEIPASVTAKSFASVLKQKSKAHHAETFGYFTDAQRMIRTDRWKYILYPQVNRTQLFDLHADPSELHNLSGSDEFANIESKLAARLQEWRRRQGDPLLNRN